MICLFKVVKKLLARITGHLMIIALFSQHNRDIVIHNNNIFDFPLPQIQLFVYLKLGIHQFFYKIIILIQTCIQMIQSLLEAQYAKPHILGGNKSILIKKRNLDATATNIHNGCSVFNNLKKSLSLKSDGFII